MPESFPRSVIPILLGYFGVLSVDTTIWTDIMEGRTVLCLIFQSTKVDTRRIPECVLCFLGPPECTVHNRLGVLFTVLLSVPQ